MQINEREIENLVRAVLSEMNTGAPKAQSSSNTKTAKVAMLTAQKNIQVK